MSLSLDDAIRSKRIANAKNDGFTLSLAATNELARIFNLPGWKIEAHALKLDIIPTRYLRNMDQIAATAQAKLLESSVAQVGLGGLGGTLFETFLRTGIGRIRAADGDHFEESNLNRQALATPDTLGMPKAAAATQQAKNLNPSVEVDCRNEFLTEATLPDFLSDCDIVIDALGGLKDRHTLQQAAARAGLPMVTGALAGWTGYVSVVMPGRPGPADFMGQNNAAEETLGCPAPAVNFVASLMATEAIKILVNTPKKHDFMLVIDLNTLTFQEISI